MITPEPKGKMYHVSVEFVVSYVQICDEKAVGSFAFGSLEFEGTP